MSAAQMAKLTQGLPTKSEKMRVLSRAGYSRAEIAKHVGASYQFVRNVLVREATRQSVASHPGGATEGAGELGANRIRIGASGEITLPSEIRTTLGLKPGDTLLAMVEDGEIRLMTLATAVQKARQIVRQYVPEGVSLVDELLEDRRREVERESQQ